MTEGWLRIHRCLAEKPWWLKEKFTRGQAWVDMLMMANHKDNEIVIQNSYYSIPVGSFVTSQRKLAKRWKWSIGAVNFFLNFLKKAERSIEYKTEHSFTHIYVLNWLKFQKDNLLDEHSNEQKVEHSLNTRRTLVETNKNDKNIYNTDTNKSNGIMVEDNKRNIKEKKEELEREKEENAKRYLQVYNEVRETKYTSVASLKENLSFWLKYHTWEDITEAIKNISKSDFWNDKMTPEILLRRKKPNGEPADWIEALKHLREKDLHPEYKLYRPEEHHEAKPNN